MDGPESYGSTKPLQCLGGLVIETLKLRNLAKVPSIMENPELHLDEVRHKYQRMQFESSELLQLLIKISGAVPSSSNCNLSIDISMMRVYSGVQMAYGIILTLAMVFNTLLRALEPDVKSLVQESAAFANQIIILAQHAAQHRPIGASYIPLCLIVAWATMDDTSKRMEVAEMIGEFQPDFPQIRWMERAIFLKVKFETLRARYAANLVQVSPCTNM
jgi:hypothetical protein